MGRNSVHVKFYLFLLQPFNIEIRNPENVSIPILVQTAQLGQPGQPRKHINKLWLENALSHNWHISQSRLSKALRIDRKTLWAWIRDYGLEMATKFDDVSDEDLDNILREFKLEKPGSGWHYAIGHLQMHGICIQQEHVHLLLRRIDGLGQELWRHAVLVCQTYSVPRSNHLWHIDGHHKLIWWGIVIHGIIDGYCRTVWYILIWSEHYVKLTANSRLQDCLWAIIIKCQLS